MFRAKSELPASTAEQVLDAVDEALLVFDRDDRVRSCNRAFTDLWSVPRAEVLAADLAAVVSWIHGRSIDRASLAALDDLLGRPEERGTVDLVLSDDTYVRLSTQPLTGRRGGGGRIWRFSNQTAQKRSELAMLHAQKLESLGVLAGGMAHDFNNLLSSIMGHSELGLADVAPDSPAADSLRAIARAAERASGLTQQLLAYAGKGTVLVEPVDLSALVEEVIGLLRISIPQAVDIETMLAPDLPPIIADATQVRQVVMNLLLNAAEAIEAPGRISVRTGTSTLGPREIARSVHDTSTAPGDFVYLRVSDSGCGMDEAMLSRVFDPFFSTKFTGRGLGLAAVLGIVRGHRGLLEVESRPRIGTTFTVHLPRGYAPQRSSGISGPDR
jgi:signal transduction histidine kinase